MSEEIYELKEDYLSKEGFQHVQFSKGDRFTYQGTMHIDNWGGDPSAPSWFYLFNRVGDNARLQLPASTVKILLQPVK